MNCKTFQESVVEYFLGDLESGLSAQFDEHLADGCPNCQRALDGIVSGVNVLLDASPATPLTDAKRAAILHHVEQLSPREPSEAVVHRHKKIDSASSVRIAAAGALSMVAGWLVAMMLLPSIRMDVEAVSKSQGTSSSNNQRHTGELSSLDRVPPNLRLAEDEFRMTSFASLRQSAIASGPSGKVIWDPLVGEIHFYGSGFAVPAAGEKVVLWAEDPIDRTLRSIPLDVQANGQCRVVMKGSPTVPPKVFTTIEMNGASSSQPSGDPFLSQEM